MSRQDMTTDSKADTDAMQKKPKRMIQHTCLLHLFACLETDLWDFPLWHIKTTEGKDLLGGMPLQLGGLHPTMLKAPLMDLESEMQDVNVAEDKRC